MPILVYGLSQSLDGYVDHTKLGPPAPAAFRHFIEQGRGLTVSSTAAARTRSWSPASAWERDCRQEQRSLAEGSTPLGAALSSALRQRPSKRHQNNSHENRSSHLSDSSCPTLDGRFGWRMILPWLLCA